MAQIELLALEGSALPVEVSARGQQQCWVLLVDGKPQAGPFSSHHDALNCQAMWHLHYNAASDE